MRALIPKRFHILLVRRFIIWTFLSYLGTLLSSFESLKWDLFEDRLLCRKHCLKKSSLIDLHHLARVRKLAGSEIGSASKWDHVARSF